ncbi:hypothetical protein AR457_16525 [Streptomyces agglomeratus]|uniref:SpdD protein n=1 Tax=Streptomyces agglomeratus TaxID=285458 RepID=A0A1E5P8D9_9ACTN|nr:hypothetical protein [Streptomyces agglomeratus]OEJ25821.1 hypothetical protein AS594_16290 [Streptomyces agglomeratus]OEJ40122.1 hypothetical protein BGK70_20125 [Streptomyces agglomeratus]OEJ45498.1 hypothetical protein AR457_16525 [Streptomyces agglomeratus]OEJ52685.1 hypothetical protein BGK72_19825 [Streptomyces agglomeratus]
MFKPKYPQSDTHTALTPHTEPVPVPARPAVAPVGQATAGLVGKVRSKPTTAVVGVVAVGAVLVSTLLAVAITGLALSISGVVLLLLVRLLRQELNR